jgi:rhodanese-related sulfurtransferase
VRASENEDPAPSPSADVPVGDDNPGFWWNPGTLKWVRDDKRGKPLSEWEEGGMTKITPKTGEAYTVWPAIHIQLSQFGLKSIPVEETLKLVKGGKAVVVDVRPEYQYKQEHVESSLNIPLFRKCQGDSMMASVKQLSCSLMGMQATERNPDFEQDAKKALGAMGKEGDDKMLIVACTIGGTLETEVKRETSMRKTSFKDPDRAFGRESRSLKAAFELIGLGYTNIAHLEGGIAMWRHKDMPMAK